MTHPNVHRYLQRFRVVNYNLSVGFQQQFGVNLGYVQSPMSQQPQPESWHQHSENNAGISRKGLSLNLTNSLWPSRVRKSHNLLRILDEFQCYS